MDHNDYGVDHNDWTIHVMNHNDYDRIYEYGNVEIEELFDINISEK